MIPPPSPPTSAVVPYQIRGATLYMLITLSAIIDVNVRMTALGMDERDTNGVHTSMC